MEGDRMNKYVMMLVTLLIVMQGCVSIESKHKTVEVKEVEQELHQAVQANDIARVKGMLKTASLDEPNQDGDTPLLVAVKNNHIEISQLLIDAGANINYQNHQQDSPYLYAGAEGRTEILRYMLQHATPDEQVFNRYGGNALIPAAEKGHLNNVRLLLEESNTDIDHQNNFGYTALIEAIALTDGSKRYQDIVRVLLVQGANQQLKDNNNKTALDYAKERNYSEMIALLQYYQ